MVVRGQRKQNTSYAGQAFMNVGKGKMANLWFSAMKNTAVKLIIAPFVEPRQTSKYPTNMLDN